MSVGREPPLLRKRTVVRAAGRGNNLIAESGSQCATGRSASNTAALAALTELVARVSATCGSDASANRRRRATGKNNA